MSVHDNKVDPTSALSTGGDEPFTLFGANLGDIGTGLSGVGSIIGGVSDFLNIGETRKQANRQYDLSLGNFANQAQMVNNQQEALIRTRLGNQGISPDSPGYAELVQAELAKVAVGSDPASAQAGPQGTAPQAQSGFLPSLPAGDNAVQPQGQPAPVGAGPQVSPPISMGARPQAQPQQANTRGRM